MSPLPVRSRALYGRPLRMTDGQVPARAVVPMFDEKGRVQKLLLVLAVPPGVAMLDWRWGLVRVPLIGAIRIYQALDTLQPLSRTQIDAAGALWHFDPDWLLDDPTEVSAGRARAFKSTNCAGRWRAPVGSLFLARNLSRIVMVSLSKPGGFELGRWKSSYLPARSVPVEAPAQSSTRSRLRWQLRPIWQV